MPLAEVAFTDRFWPSVEDLDGAEAKRVVKAVNQLSEDPDHPSLNLHPVHSDATGLLYTARASQDLRILLARQGAVHLLDRAGHHDAVYEIARRTRLVLNASSGTIRVVEVHQRTASTPAAVTSSIPPPPAPERGVFDHWGDHDLAEAGYEKSEIAALRSCATEDDLLTLDWDEDSISRAIDMLGMTPEEWRTPSLDPIRDAEERLRRFINDAGALARISPLFTAEEVARIAAAPIEDWMIFLHPEQRAAVHRRYEGPARVRGGAGTGKTVVALHRAAELARRFTQDGDGPSPPVLFTTFIRTLPPVLERLYERLPTAVPGAVDFVNIDRLANRVCRQAGDPVITSPRDIEAAFASACRRVLTTGSALERAGLTRSYLREEVTSVIKGRGVTSVDEYLALERTGRRTPFPASYRTQLWELHEAWNDEMSKRGTVDFPDVVKRARDHARRLPAPTYRTAIVDEAQDLTLVGLQLVRALVNGPERTDRADGLLIVGDGAQRIYAGGFTLRQAGIEVRGRTTVLRTNYRNTAEIISAALAVAGNVEVDDLGDVYERGQADITSGRVGFKPVLVSAAGLDDELRFVAQQIERLVESGAVGPGDMAVCVATNKLVSHVCRTLDAAGIKTQDLKDYEGESNDFVKVGTHFRAKGLEFKVVFLPGLGDGQFPRPPMPGQDPAEYEEQTGLAVSQLFVAMTRARDGLFLLASGTPSPVLEPALDDFEILET